MQNSQKNTYVRVSVLIKLQASLFYRTPYSLFYLLYRTPLDDCFWPLTCQHILKSHDTLFIQKKIHEFHENYHYQIYNSSKVSLQRCSSKQMFWKYAANLQENIHAEVWFRRKRILKGANHDIMNVLCYGAWIILPVGPKGQSYNDYCLYSGWILKVHVFCSFILIFKSAM